MEGFQNYCKFWNPTYGSWVIWFTSLCTFSENWKTWGAKDVAVDSVFVT